MRPQDVRAACKTVYGVSPGNRSRSRLTVRSRQTFVMICREVIGMTLEEIARMLRMDHTTVIYHLHRAPDNVMAKDHAEVIRLARKKYAYSLKRDAKREVIIHGDSFDETARAI